MRVRFLRGVATPHGVFAAGDVFSWPDRGGAEALIRHGVAESAEPAKAPAKRQPRKKPAKPAAPAEGA